MRRIIHKSKRQETANRRRVVPFVIMIPCRATVVAKCVTDVGCCRIDSFLLPVLLLCVYACVFRAVLTTFDKCGP